ncbi:UNVERIFIED_CONTAM: hypothetical protein PYX00_004448 [Menopon gallinae]|uniref:Uncharacterized protein n=1 Tax=Menopon gallinae TaxID=328185 RepID=A0AAW2I480_9NEOP
MPAVQIESMQWMWFTIQLKNVMSFKVLEDNGRNFPRLRPTCIVNHILHIIQSPITENSSKMEDSVSARKTQNFLCLPSSVEICMKKVFNSGRELPACRRSQTSIKVDYLQKEQ